MRHHTTTRQVLDDEGKQIGYEQIDMPFTAAEELEADQREAEAAAAALIVPVPQSVSMRQARLALLGAGMLDGIKTAIATMPAAAQIEWEYATEVRRDAPLIAGVQTSTGMTDAQIDALFVTAAGL